VRSGGELTLASGVTPPPSPPELTTGWQKVASLPKPEERADVNGLARWGDKWVRAVNVLGSEGDTLDRIETYTADGSLADSFFIDVNPRHGVAVIGDIVYTLGQEHVRNGRTFMDGYSLNTGARVSRWNFPGLADNRKVGICEYNGRLTTVAVSASGNTLYFRDRHPVTGAENSARTWNVV